MKKSIKSFALICGAAVLWACDNNETPDNGPIDLEQH